MPEQLRVYVSYDDLLAKDVKAILGDVENTYDRMNAFLKEKKRVSRADRLRVASVYTGRSIEIVLRGDVATIIAVIFLIRLVQEQHHLFWQTQKTKFEAKLAEKKLQSTEPQEGEQRIRNAVNREDASILRAIRSLRKLFRLIDRSKRIKSIEITLKMDEDAQDFNPSPRRLIRFDDE